MEHVLSLVLGLVFAWTLLFFIGPKRVSYYTQAPVQPVELSDLDKMMEAVGLAKSSLSVAETVIIEARAPAPVAVTEPEQSLDFSDQGTQTTPQPAVPSPCLAPLDE
jgi:hypothetical protein